MHHIVGVDLKGQESDMRHRRNAGGGVIGNQWYAVSKIFEEAMAFRGV